MTTVHRYPEKLAVLRLAAGAEVPEWAESSSLFSITASATETALICAGRSVPTKVPGDRGLIGFTLAETPTPSAGVLLALLTPLAEDEISVHTITTFTSVWVLVPGDDADRATEAWRRHGYDVEPAPVQS